MGAATSAFRISILGVLWDALWAFLEIIFGTAGGSDSSSSESSHRPSHFEFVDLSNEGPYDIFPVSGFLSEDSDHSQDWQAVPSAFPTARVKAIGWASQTMPNWLGTVSSWLGIKAAQRFVYVPPVVDEVKEVWEKWHKAQEQAELSGERLAQELLRPREGRRPSTLVGFSLGCHVLYSALCSLSERDIERNVQNLVLLGGAVRGEREEWRRISRTLPGEIVNVYNRDDRVLKFLYRVAEGGEDPIGTSELSREFDIGNVIEIDGTELTRSHLGYRENMDEVLESVRDSSEWL